MKKTLTIFAVLILVSFSLFATVSAHNEHGPSITLSPPQGFAMTMIAGTGFDDSKTISISYDGAVQITVPEAIKTDSNGCFTAIISIPDELAVGAHTITATQSHGDSASSTFTVVRHERSTRRTRHCGNQMVKTEQMELTVSTA